MTKSASNRSKKSKKDNDRVLCPFCKELIVSGAKKCRFCKERLDKVEKPVTNKSNFFTRKIKPSAPYKLWVLSMVLFLISIGLIQANPESYWWAVMLTSVAVGFIAFFTLIASIPGSNGKYGIITLFTFILFFGILFNYDTVATAFGLEPTFKKSNARNENIVIEPTTSPTPTPTKTIDKQPAQLNNTSTVQSNKVECIGPDGKQFTTTMDECKNLNEKWGKPVDYILNCNIHPDCGGGTVRMSKSQCESPCSGLENNSLVDCYVASRVFKLTKNECDELVKKANEPLGTTNYNSDWEEQQKKYEQEKLQNDLDYLKAMEQAAKSNESMYKNCVASADGAKTRQVSFCNNYQMGESYKESCIRQAESTYLIAVGQCKTQYNY